MPDLSQLTRTTVEAPLTRYALVIEAPASTAAAFEVEIPGFAERHVYQIRRWQSRGTTLPAVGDECLVVFDDLGEPWVPGWWPAGGDIASSGITKAELENFAIAKTLIDAKGDLLVGTAADTIARLAIGSNDTLLIADSSKTPGMKWAGLPTDSVDAAQIKENAVGAAEIAANAVGESEIASEGVGAAELATGAKQLFLQLASGATRKVNFGSGELEYPGGSLEATAKEITHGLGATPIFAAPIFEDAGNVPGAFAYGGTTFKVRCQKRDGSSPGAGTKAPFHWAAIG